MKPAHSTPTRRRLPALARVLPVLLAGALAVTAQEGDDPGEAQPMLVPADQIPPAPVLPPADALRSFRLAEGFRIELVASEPLVHDPIAMAFDPEGRIWVLELRGFMPNVDGAGEFNRVGSVAVLDDTDGDGRMDSRRVFVDGLVMPRAIALVRDGLLVAEPPVLWFCRDRDGDGVADERTKVADDYATQADPNLGGKANPEHASNGLLWALDNWIYSANHTVRFRNTTGAWEREPTLFRGQWGLSQDDYGRLVYNSNSDQLRIDLFPGAYLRRNPHFPDAPGANVDPVRNQKTWPIRVTPGINRGYQTQMLRDGRLAVFTAACGPVIYRGDLFPAEFNGNAFVCEPAGHLVKRNILEDRAGIVTGRHAYEDREFLASTDERFRPVNAYNGPDGALYIVDLYRGIIQHRIYMTTYLRRQVEARNLDAPLGLGRIYRIVPEAHEPRPRPALSRATSAHLARALAHPNGWWRDTAQRLLVERADPASIAPLRQMAAQPTHAHLARLHALWTLEGLRGLDLKSVAAALHAGHPKLRVAGIRLAERFLEGPPAAETFSMLQSLLARDDLETRIQLAFTFGQLRHPRAFNALLQLARGDLSNPYLRGAILSGLAGRELEFLKALAASIRRVEPGQDELWRALARCVWVERDPDRVASLLQVAASASPPWQALAIIDGMLDANPAPAPGRPAPPFDPLKLEAEPAALRALARSTQPELTNRLERLAGLFSWPGRIGAGVAPPPIPLTPEQQQRFEQGKELYLISCGACHQPHGNGQEGLAPPLAGSEWTIGSTERLIRIALHGMRGPITVKGQVYQLEMPAFGVFDDEQLASILTYIRREWGHTASPIDPDTVARIRAATSGRIDAWSEPELLELDSP